MNEVNLSLTLASSILLGAGVYLLLERSLSRVLVGLMMMGNGVSLAFMVASGPEARPPIVDDGTTTTSGFTDPLPQAMVLTAIVITLASVAFALAMAYRSWQINGHDDVQDDAEDALIRRLAASDVTSEAYAASDGPSGEDASDFSEGDTDEEVD